MLLKLSHASTLSIWNKEIQAKSSEVNYAPAIYGDTFWLQSFGRVIILLWQMPKFMRYYTVFALFYFEFEGDFQVQASGGLYLEERFNGGFFALRFWGTYI